uniref:Floricaula/leafy-like transcription factor n=1 Tax=Neotinea maculata TaxID=59328 RepID=Q84L02_9ASPA|nr:LFY-like protein OrcLFY [Neotinea maculata]
MVLATSQQHHQHNPHEVQQHLQPHSTAAESSRELEEVFEGYGVRYSTIARIGDLGFTASTLAGMREEEVDDMMATLSHLFRWDLLVGERYGIKAAIRAERRRLEALIFSHVSGAPHLNHQHQMGYLFSSAATGHHLMPDDPRRRLLLLSPDHHNALDALSQEGLSEEPVQLEREAAGSGGEVVGRRDGKGKTQQRQISGKKKESCSTKSKKKKKKKGMEDGDHDDEEEMEVWGRGASIENDEEEDGEESQSEQSSAAERQREHPFIVTEPGEVARAKKNGLDYLFNLYEQCHEFLLQVQAVAKERGDKCPTKVTNLVFRYAKKKVGASYINKPKMRHYVHCYALHVLDEDASNSLRRGFKERGENVGAWRLACYKPLVSISAAHSFDIDAVFNAHPRLSIWYVPTKLRQLCHLARSSTSQLPQSSPPTTTTLSTHFPKAVKTQLQQSPSDRPCSN